MANKRKAGKVGRQIAELLPTEYPSSAQRMEADIELKEFMKLIG